jgi:hypothetical protein
MDRPREPESDSANAAVLSRECGGIHGLAGILDRPGPTAKSTGVPIIAINRNRPTAAAISWAEPGKVVRQVTVIAADSRTPTIAISVLSSPAGMSGAQFLSLVGCDG